jgi:hypothetical protein
MPQLKPLADACAPRPSVFDRTVRDTVYSVDDLDQIDARAFFAENFATEGMKQLLVEAFKRLEGKSASAAGTFLLSQSMGGGKTHNLIALGLLAKHPELRATVMQDFYAPGPLGAVRVVRFSGRQTNTPFGIWGEIAEQLNKKELFRDSYSPLKPPGDREWIELLRGEPVLLLLDELPPYFEAARAIDVGATTLDTITTTALANLLVAVTNGKLPNICLVLTDLRSSAYSAGSAAVNQALENLQQEVNRSVLRIDPVRLNTNELYQILRTRLFETLPAADDIEAIAEGYQQAVDVARRMDATTATPEQARADVRNAYPFHPAIRDLYARFKENPSFQQTRALIRIMRLIVADLWRSGQAQQQYLIGAHDLDLQHAEILSEIRQINASLDTAIAHDIASEGGNAVAEQIDGPSRREARDAAKLIFLSSLSQAVNPTLGLSRSEVVAALAAPGRDISAVGGALDALQSQAWYLHATITGALLFKNTENLQAKRDNYARDMLRPQRETELRDQLKEMFAAKLRSCYQDVECLPALDEVTLSPERITLIVFRPAATALAEIRSFFDHQQYKNRVLFLTGPAPAYDTVLSRSATLRAMRTILKELKEQGTKETDPQWQDAELLKAREESNFYQACRETFQMLYYPTRHGLTSLDLDPKYVANEYKGEDQIIAALKDVAFKYRSDVTADDTGFRNSLENKLWPEGLKEVPWADIKRRAATDPSWLWHHPRALDDLKDELVRREIWRERAGFVERGPFPKPPTSALVQQVSRDPYTGEALLKVRPQHGDVVYVRTGDGSAMRERLDGPDYRTTALKVWFEVEDSRGEHEIGVAAAWQNTLEARYRFFQEGDQLRCELRAVPGGEVLYTLDGSSPETSGLAYTEPFVVPEGTRIVLAMARGDGPTSTVVQGSVPDKVGPAVVSVDPVKPATWRKRHSLQATGETYEWLEKVEAHHGELAGPRLTAAKDGLSVELLADERLFFSVAKVREAAAMLVGMIAGGSLSLDVEALRFASGQDLLGLVADEHTALSPGEVVQ